MRRISSLQLLLLLLAGIATVRQASSSPYPVFEPPALLASSHPMPSVALPPVSHARISIPERTLLLPAVTRRQIEELPAQLAQEREPSCAELKSMWRKMRRISRQMEITNEIPKLQDPFVSSAYHYKPSKYPDGNPYTTAKSSSVNVFQKPTNRFDTSGQVNLQPQQSVLTTPNFGKIIRDPDEHHRYYTSVKSSTPSRGTPVHVGFDDFDKDTQYPKAGYKNRGRVPGRFSNIPLPEESLGMYGTMVHSPEEKARFRARARTPPETGFKTRWVGMDSGSSVGRVPFRPVQRHEQYHYGSEVTHGDRRTSGTSGDRFSGSRPVVGMYRSHPMGGFAEYPNEIGQRSNSAARVERIDKIAAASGRLKNVCLRLQNKTCKTDVDCYCSGSPKLFCGGNRCRPRYKAQKYGKNPKWGKSWYVDPYEKNLVEYGFKRDPLWPAPF